jgi:glycosyltransferase involved in cell wall biosynthesis
VDVALVSILTPAYNAADYLAQTIHSVQRQTITDFELLVVDDGSTDDTPWIVEQFASRDRRIRLLQQPNAGTAAARNTAIRNASSSVLALLDSDDLWTPDYLEVQLRILEEHPDVDILSANAFNFGGPLHGTPLKPASDSLSNVSLLDLIEVEDSLCILSIFRARVVETTGGFNASLRCNEDYDLWLRAALADCRIVFNARPCGFYRRRPDSMSASEWRMLTGILDVLRGFRAQCTHRPVELAALDKQIASLERRWLLAEGKAALVERDFTAAREVFARLEACATGSLERTIARVGKTVPELLLLAYRARLGWRSSLRGGRIHFVAFCA